MKKHAMLRIQELKLPLDHPEPALRQAILKRLALADQNLTAFTVFKRAYVSFKASAIPVIYTIDARGSVTGGEDPPVIVQTSFDPRLLTRVQIVPDALTVRLGTNVSSFQAPTTTWLAGAAPPFGIAMRSS